MGWWVGKEVEKGRRSRHVRDTWHEERKVRKMGEESVDVFSSSSDS